MGLRNLAVRDHAKSGRHAAQQAGHGGADRVWHQQAGGQAQVFLAARGLGGAAGERVGHAGVQRRAVRRGQCLGHQALELGLQRNDFQLLHRAVDLLHDGRGQLHPHALGELGRVGHVGGVL